MSGISKATTVRTSMPAAAPTFVRLNVCLSRPQPPTNIARPSTRSKLPRMLPVSDALTTSVRPRCRASKTMISSAALPNVALRKPPTPAPTYLAASSVAEPINPARGTIASAEVTNTRRSLTPRKRKTSATGRKTINQLSGCPAS